MNTEELYREIKNVWQSVYPIYFDSSKTIAQGFHYKYLREKSAQIARHLIAHFGRTLEGDRHV